MITGINDDASINLENVFSAVIAGDNDVITFLKVAELAEVRVAMTRNDADAWVAGQRRTGDETWTPGKGLSVGPVQHNGA